MSKDLLSENAKPGISLLDLMKGSKTYSHRNGETEPPSVDRADLGEWFWYDGSDNAMPEGEWLGMFWVSPGEAMDTKGNKTPLSELHGRWWGPVTPPWETSE